MAVALSGDCAARRTETPAGVMTTLASPSQGASERLSLWRVEMPAGRSGPIHVFDSEQIWTVISGRTRIVAGDEASELGSGDTIVLPAGIERQVRALEDAVMVVCGYGDAIASVPGEDVSRGTPAWIA
jgi:quercetin dioxygenase-like cupin family protein